MAGDGKLLADGHVWQNTVVNLGDACNRRKVEPVNRKRGMIYPTSNERKGTARGGGAGASAGARVAGGAENKDRRSVLAKARPGCVLLDAGRRTAIKCSSEMSSRNAVRGDMQMRDVAELERDN